MLCRPIVAVFFEKGTCIAQGSVPCKPTYCRRRQVGGSPHVAAILGTCPTDADRLPAASLDASAASTRANHKRRGGKRHENPRRRRIGQGQAAGDHGGRPRRAQGRRGAGRGEGDGHLPHRRIHALGRRPRRAVPGHPGPRGRRHRRRHRAGRDEREEGRPRHSALHARMPAMPIVPFAQDQPVHRHPRDAGPGRHAGRHLALLARWQEAAPLHGHLHVREFHRAARDRGRQDPRGRSLRQGLLHRLRRHHRHRRRPQHRQGGARRQVRGIRAGRHRPQRHPGAAACRRRHDHRCRRQQCARRNGASASA